MSYFSFASWLKNRKANVRGTRRNRPHSAARAVRSARPSAELLEDRITPSHFRYGTITWTPGTGNAITFNLQQAWRRDFPWNSLDSRNPALPNPGATLYTPYLFEFGDSSTPVPLTLTVDSVDATQDILTAHDTIGHTYATTGSFIADFDNAARLSSLVNNHDGEFRNETLVDVGAGNSSPVSSLAPVIQVPTGSAIYHFQIPAADANGNVLTYRLSTSAEAGGSGGFIQAPNISISSTGLVSWNEAGTTLGQLYSAQVMIEDHATAGGPVLSKTPVDFILQVTSNTDPAPTVTANPAGPFTIAPGQPLSFQVTANDEAGDTIVGLQALNAPAGMTFSPFTSGNPTSITASWTPTFAQSGQTYVITFQTIDDHGATGTTSVTITVTATAPVVTPPSDQTATEGASATFSLGSFTDPDGGPWNVDVSWGDGSPDTTYSVSTAGSLGTKSHTYAEEGSKTVTVKVTDNTTLSGSATFKVAVADPAVVATGTGGALAPSYNPSFTFTDQIIGVTMTLAFDGTHYWSSSGNSTFGNRYAEYTSSGALVATYAPGLDFRSVFTDGAGNVYARQFNDPTIYKQTSPGVFAPAGVVLSGGPLDAQSSVVFNGAGTEFIAMSGGTVSRWDTSGNFLGTVALSGFGSVAGENNYPQYRGIAALGSDWLTYSNGTLSVWDQSGNRLGTTTLVGAGTSFDSHFSLSEANGRVFIVTVAGGTWDGYSVPLIGGITAVEGQSVTAAVATFTDPGGPEADFAYGDFSSTAGLQLNGNAAQSGNALRLVPADFFQAGSAFLTTPVSPNASFESQFQFLLSNAGGIGKADGLTFMIQNSAGGASALGGAGGALGYAGISPSVAVEFDIYYNPEFGDTDDNHVGVLTNGSMTESQETNPGFSLFGAPITAWVDYDATTHTLSVFVSTTATKPGSALLSTTIDLGAILGGDSYVGFSAGTGAGFADHDLLNWKFYQNGGGHYSADIDWGDSSSSAGTIAFDPATGNYVVSGSHTYGEEGSYPVVTTIHHETAPDVTATSSATVADAALTAGTVSATGGVEGVTPASLSATFTDANAGATPADFSGSIDWGDGNTTSFTSADVSGGGGSYTVTGSHVYAEEGTYNITVTVNDDGGSSTTVSGSTTVADAALTPGTVSASGGVEGVTPTGLSATFTDANAGATPTDFSGTIDWGDGQITNFTSADVSGSGGSYTVSGSHQYAEEGSYNITVVVNDDGSSTTTVTGSTTVADAALTGSGAATAGGTEGATNSSVLSGATFTDANPGDHTADFTATITWGDGGPTSTGTVSYSGGVYTVSGTHTYAEEGSYSISIAVSDDGGSTATITGTATVADPSVVATAVSFSPVAGAPFSGAVAKFTDPGGAEALGDYSATINWGDSLANFTGAITGGAPLGSKTAVFTVSGGHTYAAAGTYTVTITIYHDTSTPTVLTYQITATKLGKGVQQGQAATIGFWQGKTGQALINKFGLTAANQSLGQWLATTFPKLYGGVNGAPNLSGYSNAQVGGYYQTLFNVSAQNLDAEVMDTALSVFATTSSLGGTTATAYGFKVDVYGLGAYSWNVGSSGTAFGVPNNTTLNVYQLLLAANNSAVNGLAWGTNTALRKQALLVFDALNRFGDIS